MTNKEMIKLIKELKEKKILPSKKKTILLTNFNYLKLKFFLKLLEIGYIRQDNVNKVIDKISKINLHSAIDEKSLESLFYEISQEDNVAINDEILNVILKNLMINNSVIIVGKLSNLKNYSDNFKELIEYLDNDFLIKNNLLEDVIDYYLNIYTIYPEEVKKLRRLQEVLNNENIQKQFNKKENKLVEKDNYMQMLHNFSSCNLDVDSFNKTYNLISNICANRKISIDDINSIIGLINFLEKKDLANFVILESVLLTSNCYCYGTLFDVISIINHYDQYQEENANVAFLTKEIFRILKEKRIVKKSEHEHIFSFIMSSINASKNQKNNHDMKSINELVIRLLETNNIQKYFKESQGYSFISSSLLLDSKNIDKIITIASNESNLSQEFHFDILNSFSEDSELCSLEARADVLSEKAVMNEIKKNSVIFSILNDIFDYYFSFVSKEERKILKYPIFLRSEFFQNDYYELLRGQECRIDGLSINYLNNFFRVLKTFNIDDPNLNFYLETILDSFSSEEEIENFHKERIKNKDAGIEVVGNSLYDILATSNEEAVEKYITMLEQAPSDLDLKSDTKTVYQKK